jgi:hypothetical protein
VDDAKHGQALQTGKHCEEAKETFRFLDQYMVCFV